MGTGAWPSPAAPAPSEAPARPPSPVIATYRLAAACPGRRARPPAGATSRSAESGYLCGPESQATGEDPHTTHVIVPCARPGRIRQLLPRRTDHQAATRALPAACPEWRSHQPGMSGECGPALTAEARADKALAALAAVRAPRC